MSGEDVYENAYKIDTELVRIIRQINANATLALKTSE